MATDSALALTTDERLTILNLSMEYVKELKHCSDAVPPPRDFHAVVEHFRQTLFPRSQAFERPTIPK